MKWINHKITTFSLVFISTHNFVGSIIAAAGSIIPDALEGKDFSSNRWKKNHRRISHWLAGYLGIGLFLWILLKTKLKANPLWLSPFKLLSHFSVINSESVIYFALHIGLFLSVGCILHILEDALSSTVPLLHPTKRVFSIGMMKTGSVMEYVLSFALLGVALFIT